MKFKTLHRLLIVLVIIFSVPPIIVASQGEPTATPAPNAPSDTYLYFIPMVRQRPASTPVPTQVPPSPTQTLPPPAPGAVVINHNSIAQFDHIPDRYLQTARNLGMLFSDRSVGANISEALDCLTASSWAVSPASCRNDYYNSNWNWRTFTQTDLQAGVVPSKIMFTPNPTKYNRSNWTYEYRQGMWSDLTREFIQTLAPSYLSSKDVLTYQFSYLNVTETDDISNPTTGFFANNANKYDIYDLETFIGQHPDKRFFFWTTSLSRGIGTDVSTDFNQQMRSYALSHGKVLFDVADIEAYTDQGVPCYDNRDGVQYCNQGGNCENNTNDGINLPAICQDYTTELEGGHLGSVSGAQIRLAKAFWVLMARIAGWDGVSP